MPVQAPGDIRDSARRLNQVVDRALAETGADAVDLVRHSQGGGILSDYYLRFLRGSEKVQTKVGISRRRQPRTDDPGPDPAGDRFPAHA